MSRPEISVIIPIYNQEHRLKKCLASLLSQSYDDYETIIIDDGSNDDCDKLAKSMLTNGHIPRMINHNAHLGMWASRRNAIMEARGRLILFLDPREWLENDALLTLVTAMNDTCVDLVQMKRQRMVRNMPLRSSDHPMSIYDIPVTGEDYRRIAGFVGRNSCVTPFCGDKLYRTDLLREAAHIDFRGKWGEVQILNIHYLRCARSMLMMRYAGINVNWTDDYQNYRFSRIKDYKYLYMLKKYLCADTESVRMELYDMLRYHLHQLLCELAWTPEAVYYFMEKEFDDPVWREAGVSESLQELIQKEIYNVKRGRLRSMVRRFMR